MVWTHRPPYAVLPISDFERRVMEFDAIVLTYRVLDRIRKEHANCHESRQGYPDIFRPDHIYCIPYYVYPLAQQLEPKANELRATGKKVLVLDGK